MGSLSSSEEIEIMSGSKTIEFAGYSITEGIGSGKHMKSPKFNVGGYEWEILFYPDGKNVGNNGYISLYLKLVNPKETTKVKALYDFKLLDKSAKPNLSTKKSTKPCIFDNETPSYGFPNFIEKTELEASDFLIDDGLRIRCLVWVFLEKSIEEVPMVHTEIPMSNLAKDFAELLETKDAADVKFTVNGKSFFAHRCVLMARSPVFKGEFGPMSGPISETINVDNMDENTFKVLLKYMYTDTLPDTDELNTDSDTNIAINNIQCLLVAADRYKIETLKLICEQKLCDSITIETVATSLGLAEKHNCPQLKSLGIEFAVKPDNFVVLVLTEGFFNLRQTCPSIIRELMGNVMNPSLRGDLARQFSGFGFLNC